MLHQNMSLITFLILSIFIIINIDAQFHVKNIPHAKLVTPSKDELENITEPTPFHITGATFLPETRIIGGEPTDIKNYPFMVNILKDNKHWCGGSYYEPNWILTAAHCLLHSRTSAALPPRIFTVRMGASNLDDSKAQERKVVRIVPHKEFNMYNNTCDIGLIEIDRPFQLSESVKFVSIPSQYETYDDKNCTVLGWGLTSVSEDTGFSNHLMKVAVPVVAESTCRNIYTQPKFSGLFYDHKTICAGYIHGGKDACQGDSGGPLILNDIQIGIVSWGIGCGNEIPGVYTNVFYFKNWINDVVQGRILLPKRSNSTEKLQFKSLIILLLSSLTIFITFL